MLRIGVGGSTLVMGLLFLAGGNKPVTLDKQLKPSLLPLAQLKQISRSSFDLKPGEDLIKSRDLELYKTLLRFKDKALLENYKKYLEHTVDVSNRLEKLNKGATVHIKGWISTLKEHSELPAYLSLLQKYTDRLAIHGETEIGDALYSLNSLQVCPTEDLINDLLKLHRYSGVLRVNRFVGKGQQKTLETTIKEFIQSFEDKNYKSNAKVVVAFLPGVIEDDGGDMFSKGGETVIKDLNDQGYKILPFEIDEDEQIKEGIMRVYRATGKTIDLAMFCGHGISTETNFGYTERAATLKRPDPLYLQKIREENVDYVRTITREGPFLPWTIKNMANGKVKGKSAYLDVDDRELMKSIAPYFNKDSVGVFASCSVADESTVKPSLARTMHVNADMKVFACTQPVRGLKLFFKDRKIVDVKFLAEDYKSVLDSTVFSK